MKRSLFILPALTALLAASPAMAQKSKDTLRLALYQDFSMVEAYYDPRPEASLMSRMVFDRLVAFDADTRTYKSGLAQSWKRIDARTMEFKLRQDVKFHDGSAMDADDVVYIINWALDPKVKLRFKRSRFGWIKSVEKIDQYTVRINSKTANSIILARLLNSSPIYPSDVHKTYKMKSDFGKKPIGTGTYKVASVGPNKGAVLVLNKNYVHGNSAKPKGRIGRIRVITVADKQTQIARMVTDQQDIMYNVDKEAALSLAKNPNLRVDVQDTISFTYVMFDSADRTGIGHFKNRNVRKAVLHAINRDAMRQLLHPRVAGKPLQESACHSWHQACASSLKPPKYNPKEAKRLLAEAGLAKGFPLSILSWGEARGAAEAVAGQLRKVGIRAKVNYQPFRGFLKARRVGSPLIVTLWDNAVGQPDVDNTASYFFLPGARNYNKDKRLLKAVMDGRAEIDLKKREAIYRKAFDLVTKEHYIMPLIPIPAVVLHNKRVKMLRGHKNPKGFQFNRIVWN